MKKQIDLSIIVPTLNEESFIGILLDSIISQTVWPKEVVVVDAFSTDATVSEVEKRQKLLPCLKYYQIKKSTISKQRNYGAMKTKANHLLFLDADTKLQDKKALEKYIEEIKQKRPDVAAATNLPLSKSMKNKIIFVGADVAFRAMQPVWPMALGINMYFKRTSFDAVGGFDETLRFAEDHEVVQRLVKCGGKFIFLNNPKIHTSTRRMDKEGHREYVIKMVKSFLHIVAKGYNNNPTQYKYGHFK